MQMKALVVVLVAAAALGEAATPSDALGCHLQRRTQAQCCTQALEAWRATLPQYIKLQAATLASHAAPLRTKKLQKNVEAAQKAYDESSIEWLFQKSVRACANSRKPFSPPSNAALTAARAEVTRA